MNTEQLLVQLSGDLKPVRRLSFGRVAVPATLGLVAYIFLLPSSRKFELATAFFASAASAMIVNLHCPYDGHGHHFIGHGLEAFFFSAILYFPLTLVSRRITRYFVQKRTKRLEFPRINTGR